MLEAPVHTAWIPEVTMCNWMRSERRRR